MAASAATPAPPSRRLPAIDLWWPAALGLCVITGYLTLHSLHLTAAVVTSVIVLGLYVRSRRAGVMALWVAWLVLPAVRRMFDLAEPFSNADPLSAVPFVLTAVIAVAELARADLSRRAKLIVSLAVAGFAFGFPAGVLASPKAAVFGLLAYVSGALAFGIGYREARDRTLTLPLVLTLAAVPISVYGILQSLAPLTRWDAVWLNTVGPNFNSIGSKGGGDLRIFSVLNSPGTLAVVLALTVVSLLTARRFGPARAVALMVTLAALALTLVRGSWAALGVALVVVWIIAPARIGRRILLVGVLGVIAFPLFIAGNPNAHRVTKRATTFSNLGTDTSAQARINTPKQLVPVLVHNPLGQGLGTAGEASRVGTKSQLRNTDNALLSLLYQSGPVGFAMVMAAYVLGLISVARNLRRRRSLSDVLVLGCMGVLTVQLVTADVFYGVTGPIIWYLLGFAVRCDESLDRRPLAA